MATITKKQLIDRIAKNTQTNISIVRPIIQQVLENIFTELSEGNRIEFRDFGVFEIRIRAPRKAHNPKTFESVQVPAKKKVRFKMGRLMKQKLNEQSQ